MPAKAVTTDITQHGWITPLIDLLFAAAYLLLLPKLTLLFRSDSPLNGGLVVLGYAILCIASWQLLRLKPLQPGRRAALKDNDTVTGLTGFLSLCFGIVVVVMMIELSGILDEGGWLESAESDSLAGPLFGIGLFIVSLAYMFVLLIRPQPVIRPGTFGYALRHVLGVAGVNLMFVITLAFWDSQLAESSSDDVSVGLHFLLFVIFYILMVMFLAPPRIILHLIEGGRWGMASFLFWLAVYCWNMSA